MAGEDADSTDDAAESADAELPGDAAYPPFLRHGVFTVAVYRRNRPSASGLDPEGEGRKLG